MVPLKIVIHQPCPLPLWITHVTDQQLQATPSDMTRAVAQGSGEDSRCPEEGAKLNSRYQERFSKDAS